MFRDQDPALKSKALAKIVLPELYCLRVRNRSEAVIENNLLEFHAVILNPATTEVNPTALHAKNQRKTEEEIFNRGAGDSSTNYRACVIHNNISRGEPPICQQLKGQDYCVGSPENFALEQSRL